jgi:hypothetical protein
MTTRSAPISQIVHDASPPFPLTPVPATPASLGVDASASLEQSAIATSDVFVTRKEEKRRKNQLDEGERWFLETGVIH